MPLPIVAYEDIPPSSRFTITNDAGALDSLDQPTAEHTLLYSSGTGGGPPKATALSKAAWTSTSTKPARYGAMWPNNFYG